MLFYQQGLEAAAVDEYVASHLCSRTGYQRRQVTFWVTDHATDVLPN